MQSTNNSSQLNGYTIGKTIGRGTFGKVKRAIHKLTNQPVAIKFLQKQKIKDITDVERVSRQLHFLKIVRHPVIAQLYQIIETHKMIYIVMQFATGGQFFQYVMDGKIKNQQQAFHYFSQVLSALIYLHKQKICHRDVKPENMLLDSHKKIKLVDFGLSNMYKKGEKLSTACGSPCYASPEMIKGQDYDPELTDVWSLGIVLYTTVMAQLPFEDQNTNALYSKIKSGLYIIAHTISPQLKDLLNRLINVRPQNRLTLQQIKQHPWYKKYDNHKSFLGISIGYQNIPIDKNVVEQMQSLGFDNRKTIKYLQNNIKNQCTATYYLFLKRNFKIGKPSSLDICSDHFSNKSITSLFKNNSPTKQNRYKSYDFGNILEKQNLQQPFQERIIQNNRNCVSLLKYRYARNNLTQSQFPSRKNSIKSICSRQTSKNSKKKINIQSFLRTRADLEVKQLLTKKHSNEIRRKSLSVSTQKAKNLQKYQTQAIRSSNKKIRLNIINNDQKINRRFKTDCIAQIYCPVKKSKSKKQSQFVKQKVKQHPLNIDVSNIFWRKKSTALKAGNSIDLTRGIRKNAHIKF